MAQADGVISNASGAAVRADLNNQLAAVFTNHSGATAPTTTYAYQWWVDTTTGLLKIRNAANTDWVSVGSVATTNFGYALLSGATFTGDVTFGTTTATVLPVGTTAQRPTAATGQVRFNSDITKFEGYNGSAWSSIGGGAAGGGSDSIFYENGQTVTTNYTVAATVNAMSAGPITINSGVTVTIASGGNWVVI